MTRVDANGTGNVTTDRGATNRFVSRAGLSNVCAGSGGARSVEMVRAIAREDNSASDARDTRKRVNGAAIINIVSTLNDALDLAQLKELEEINAIINAEGTASKDASDNILRNLQFLAVEAVMKSQQSTNSVIGVVLSAVGGDVTSVSSNALVSAVEEAAEILRNLFVAEFANTSSGFNGAGLAESLNQTNLEAPLALLTITAATAATDLGATSEVSEVSNVGYFILDAEPASEFARTLVHEFIVNLAVAHFVDFVILRNEERVTLTSTTVAQNNHDVEGFGDVASNAIISRKFKTGCHLQ